MISSKYNSDLSPWPSRIRAANKFYGDWEGKFKCKILYDYYEGFQWKTRRDYPTTNYNPYVINMFYSTIKIKLANMLFQRPSFVVSPTPGNSNWDIDSAIKSAQLKQDVLNTIVHNPNINFTKHLKLAALDSWFRFGILEVGYAADWRNPQKEDLYMKSWEDESVPEDKDRILDNNEVPVNERFYVKRIKPQRFRVCVSEHTDLNDHDWFGYYDYYYVNTLKHTPGIAWDDSYLGGYISAEYASGYVGNSATDEQLKVLMTSGAICRVWHIWDNVAHKRRLLLDNDNFNELWAAPFERSPLIDLRWDFRESGFYPIPPTFQWISPQDEINEAREQTRSYRRRFTRKFQAVKGMVEEEEKEKFASGPDGIIVEVKQANAITAIDNPELGNSTEGALLIAKDDFNIISGTSAEARGQEADRTTATQSRIIDTRTQIRESADQLDFSGFINLVGREILCQAQEKMVEGLWVKYSADPSQEGVMQDMQAIGPLYKFIKSQDISDGYDFTVDVDVMNATPAAMQQSQQSFVNFLALVQAYPMISMSPILIREAAYRVGYKNEKVIQQMQQAAMLSMAAKAAQGAAQQGTTLQGAAQNAMTPNNPNNESLAQIAQMQPPTPQQTDTQISKQLM